MTHTCSRIKVLAATLLACAALLLALPNTAWARDSIDTSENCQLTLTKAPAGAEFSLFKVASVSESGGYSFEGAFANSDVSLAQPNQDEWAKAAAAFSAYADDKDIAATEIKTADGSGCVVFGGDENLKPGLYLVVGKTFTDGSKSYTFKHFLIQLPNLSAEGSDGWEYNVTAEVKSSSTPVPNPGDTVKVDVVKVWEGDSLEDHPSVEIQLVGSDGTHEVVTLDKGNNWRHTWSGLSVSVDWSVVELNVPEGYTWKLSVSQNGTGGKVFTITNTHTPDEPDNPDNPDNPDEPVIPGGPDSPNTPTTPDAPSNPATPSEPQLPQTGQLWWPVPLLLVAGAALVVAGVARRKSKA